MNEQGLPWYWGEEILYWKRPGEERYWRQEEDLMDRLASQEVPRPLFSETSLRWRQANVAYWDSVQYSAGLKRTKAEIKKEPTDPELGHWHQRPTAVVQVHAKHSPVKHR